MPTTRKEFTEVVAQLEKLPRGNPWQAGMWLQGLWDESREFREIIRVLERS